jgi:acyl-coenzyme A thioesterase PaaI-like protein
MSEDQGPGDPFLGRHRVVPVTGSGFALLAEALRELQDVVTSVAPPDGASLAAAEQLAEVSSGLRAHRVGEWDRYAGRRQDLPGRGHPLLPPFVIDDEDIGVVRGRVVFSRYYLGGNDAAHGGTLGLLFDEVVGRTADGVVSELPARTAYLTVNYRHVTPIGRELRFEATLDRVEGRKRFASGRLYDGETLLSDAEGLFVELRPGQS